LRIDSRLSLALASFLIIAMTGCASSGTASQSPERFDNLLVIGVAGSWNSRAQFERVVVSGLRAEGVEAQSYNSIEGGSEPPSREDVLAAIDKYGFDAVVVTRVLDTDSDLEVRSAITGSKVSRKESGFMKLFRYDYEEFDDPLQLTLNVQVDFTTELYDSMSHELVWSSQTKGPKTDNVDALVDGTAKQVVRSLRRSGKLAR
jgi:hypothetical protein